MDYCTWWFEGWWSQCCQAHDAAYDLQVGKELADRALEACVSSALPAIAEAHPYLAGIFLVVSTVVGGLMYAGVKMFGAKYYRNAGNTPK